MASSTLETPRFAVLASTSRPRRRPPHQTQRSHFAELANVSRKPSLAKGILRRRALFSATTRSNFRVQPASPESNTRMPTPEEMNPHNPLLRHLRTDLPGRFNEVDALKRHWPRFAALMAGAILPPFEVLIHPSSACNLMCAWCIGDHVPIVRQDGLVPRVLHAAKTAEKRLPDTLREPEAMMRLVRGIVSYRKLGQWREGSDLQEREFWIENVQFSGLIGEPLVSKQAVMQAMNYLVEESRRVGMFTNAVLADESTWDTLVRTDYIVISIDAGSPQTYGRLKYDGRPEGPERFRRMCHNVGGLARQRASSRGSRLAINAAYIVYPENHDELYEAARIAKDLGVDCLRVKRDISGDRVLSYEQRAIALAQMERIKSDLVDDSFRFYAIHDFHHVPNFLRSFPSCTITELMAAVGSDGQLYPCNYHPRPGGAAYGDATQHPFRDIWEGEARARLKQGLPKICPKVCDPYKNRSNELLASLVDVYTYRGRETAELCRDELLDAFSRVPRSKAAGCAPDDTADSVRKDSLSSPRLPLLNRSNPEAMSD
jgi:MoaA/NifB/PqqE/SkfB family radical SAM enzyme